MYIYIYIYIYIILSVFRGGPPSAGDLVAPWPRVCRPLDARPRSPSLVSEACFPRIILLPPARAFEALSSLGAPSD